VIGLVACERLKQQLRVCERMQISEAIPKVVMKVPKKEGIQTDITSQNSFLEAERHCSGCYHGCQQLLLISCDERCIFGVRTLMQCQFPKRQEEPSGYYSPSTPLDICLAAVASSPLSNCVHTNHLGWMIVIELTNKETPCVYALWSCRLRSV
jgi:hypothetical protein